MKGARQTGPHGLRALSPPVRGPRPGPAGTPAGRGWPGPGAVPLRALTCHGQPRAKASVPGKRPRQTRGHLSGVATVCHAACPEADLQPPAGRQHARSPALGRGPGQALLVPCTQNKHPAFGGFLSLRKKKKKNANKTDSYHCFLKVTAGVPARMNLTDSKHRCAGSACSRCDAETLTSVPTAPHGCLMGLQDGGASPAGPRGAKGPGARLLRAWGRARGRWPGRLPSAPPAHCPGRTREQDIVPPGACGSRWLPNQRDEHTGQKHEAEERPVRSQPEAPPPGSGDDAPSTAGRCQRQRPGVPRGRREAWPG